jgi:hypothetical protein
MQQGFTIAVTGIEALAFFEEFTELGHVLVPNSLGGFHVIKLVIIWVHSGRFRIWSLYKERTHKVDGIFFIGWCFDHDGR